MQSQHCRLNGLPSFSQGYPPSLSPSSDFGGTSCFGAASRRGKSGQQIINPNNEARLSQPQHAQLQLNACFPIVVLVHYHLLRLGQARSCKRFNPILIP
jgi:hypothetical protein